MSTELTTKQNADELLLRLQEFTMKINSAPDERRLKKTPDGKASYLPISIIENDLREDFNGLVQYELLSERRELNEYIVTARIKVFHPILAQWMSFDGIGCVQIMQDSGATLDSFNSTKKKNALRLNSPKAYAEALKNAAKKIGIKYGSNINRKPEDVDDYNPEELIDNAIDGAILQMTDVKDLEGLKDVWDLFPEFQNKTKFKLFFNQKKTELSK